MLETVSQSRQPATDELAGSTGQLGGHTPAGLHCHPLDNSSAARAAGGGSQLKRCRSVCVYEGHIAFVRDTQRSHRALPTPTLTVAVVGHPVVLELVLRCCGAVRELAVPTTGSSGRCCHTLFSSPRICQAGVLSSVCSLLPLGCLPHHLLSFLGHLSCFILFHAVPPPPTMRLLIRSTLNAPRGAIAASASPPPPSAALTSSSSSAASSPSAASAASASSGAATKTPPGAPPPLPTRLLEVEADDLVDTTAAKAAAAFGASRPERLCLVMQGGRRLRSGRTLREYGLRDGAMLRLSRRPSTATCVIHIRF